MINISFWWWYDRTIQRWTPNLSQSGLEYECCASFTLFIHRSLSTPVTYTLSLSCQMLWLPLAHYRTSYISLKDLILFLYHLVLHKWLPENHQNWLFYLSFVNLWSFERLINFFCQDRVPEVSFVSRQGRYYRFLPHRKGQKWTSASQDRVVIIFIWQEWRQIDFYGEFWCDSFLNLNITVIVILEINSYH